MDLSQYDDKCVRIIDDDGEIYDGICMFNSAEYCEAEFGRAEDALQITCFLFYKSHIREVISLEDHTGPYGRFLDPFGHLEEVAAEDQDLIDEILECEEPEHVARMKRCLEAKGRTAADSKSTAEPEKTVSPRYTPRQYDPEKVTGICGLFCESCPAFLQFMCDGCLSGFVAPFCLDCRHGFRDCAKEHGVTWCFQCGDFPCERQRRFKDCHVENGISHHEHVMEEILRQREMGLEAWVREQERINVCPECGAKVAWCEKECLTCGAKLDR